MFAGCNPATSPDRFLTGVAGKKPGRAGCWVKPATQAVDPRLSDVIGGYTENYRQ
jgi:hypothetical protein